MTGEEARPEGWSQPEPTDTLPCTLREIALYSVQLGATGVGGLSRSPA